MLGEFPRALVCTGEGQVLGLRTTAAHMKLPHHGVVSILMSPLMVWAAIGMCWEGAVEGQGHGIMA